MKKLTLSKLQATMLLLLVTWVVMIALNRLSVSSVLLAASPIPNTTMDKDGVIRLNPQNGCGPSAHVETHPEHGQLCIQNSGSWITKSK